MNNVVSTTVPADPRPFPDVILRSQFFEMVGARSLSSEQRLMLAVLVDAINILQNSRAVASPSPDPPPVMTATASLSSIYSSHVRVARRA